MKNKIQSVRGTHDHLQHDKRKYDYICSLSQKITRSYGYDHIDTPIFEFSSVFKKSLGDLSDIVSKEMYTFKDKSNEEITLRPEGTAGIIRAIISNGLTHQLPIKVFYYGPMFRYERPQKGRLRQFHQIGIEHIGSKSPMTDIEVIACGYRILKELKIDKLIKLEINSLGNIEDRNKYKTSLLKYLKSYKNKLSEESLLRLKNNPLRILDSKNSQDIEITTGAPKITDFLNNDSKETFNTILQGLKSLGINYKLNTSLVRGLDYYGETTFEFTTDQLGSQSAILAGGRYNNLMKNMGGPDIAGIGWAAGLERLMLLIIDPKTNNNKISIIPLIQEYNDIALKIAENLRAKYFVTNICFTGNLKKKFSQANKFNSKYAIIIGEEEIKENSVLIKNLENSKQIKIKIEKLTTYFEKVFKL